MMTNDNKPFRVTVIGNGAALPTAGLLPNSLLTYMPYSPRCYAYCTDTIYSPEIAKLVKHVDILYHEASFTATDSEMTKLNGHYTTAEAAKEPQLAGAGKLLIGHLSSSNHQLPG